MFTRQDYLEHKCTHEEYYSQFVTDGIMGIVLSTFSAGTLQAAFKADPHFNTIPLGKWDNLAPLVRVSLKPYGDYLTLAGQVCILKQAARMVAQAKTALFIGIYPAGIVYSDCEHMAHGDYKRLAFLSYSTLALDIEPDAPAHFRRLIAEHAASLQARRGEAYQVSTIGQAVILGQ